MHFSSNRLLPRSLKIVVCSSWTALIMLVAPSHAVAQWKPTKPVEIIIPSGTGGSIDRFGRVLQKIIQEKKLLDVPVVVVNKNGAGGAIAWNYLNQHKGDGHYLIVSTPNMITTNLMEVSSVRHDAVTPVALLSAEYHSLIVKEDSPFKTANEVIDKLKAAPESLRIGVAPGLGVGSHVALSIVLKEAAVDQKKVKIVVFKSSGQSVTTVLGGHIDVASVGTSNALPMLKAGRVRILAMASPQRLAAIQAPTWQEVGINAVYVSWRGIAAPANLEAEQIAFWEELLAKLVDTPEWQAELQQTQYEPLYMNSAKTREFLDAQYKQLEETLLDAGLIRSRP